MTNLTAIRLRVLPRFPARIVGANGFAVVREGADLVVQPDYGQLAIVPAVPDQEETFFQAWTRDIDTYNIIPFSALVANIQDVILGDNLTAIDGLTTFEDAAVYYTGEGTASLYTVSSFTRSISGAIDAIAFREAIGLGSLATLDTINDGNWSGFDLSVANGGTGASTAAAARTNLGLGTAATANSGDFATAAEGALAGTALQPSGNLAGLADNATARANLGLGALAVLNKVSDEDLATPANITYLNQAETTLAFYGGDVVEMFTVSPARKFSIGAGSIEFDAPFEVPSGARIEAQDGAIFRPTFDLATALERATPYIKFEYGQDITRLDVRLVAGINTVRKLVEFNGGVRMGYANAGSDDPNNNRVSEGSLDAPYRDCGAFVFKGDGYAIGHLRHDNFDRGMACIGASNVWIGYRESYRHIMGNYYENSENIYIMGGNATGMSVADAETCSGRTAMEPGANNNCFAGARNVHIHGERSFGALEHANRVGRIADGSTPAERAALIAAGTSIPNELIFFYGCIADDCRGCGFKQDDGDDGLIRDVYYINPVTIDIGAGVWGEPNDGNKQAIAVRNAQRGKIVGHISRAIKRANSGFNSEWIERSSDIQTFGFDLEDARDAALLVSNNGQDIESIVIKSGRIGKSAKGLAVIPGTNHNIRGLTIGDLRSAQNTGLDIDIQARPDGASPFISTEKSRIEADATNVSIAGAVYADGDFSSNIFIGKGRVLFNPASLAAGGYASTTITVTNAAVGDRVTATFADLQGVIMSAWVSAANTVTVSFFNATAGVIDLPNAAIIALVYR